ncbi:MAG: efflux transporter outer membrane subunit [Bacteroidales bacterium]
MKKILSVIILITGLSSCLVGPKYVRPNMKSPRAWNEQSKFVTSADTITNLKWFKIFKDPVLNKLIDSALKNNYNLAVAVARIEQSRAQYGISKADLLPSFGYNAGAQLNHPYSNEFNVSGTASWEIDFWGKLRHAKRASYAQMLASEEGMKTVTTTLIVNVASCYFQIRDLDNRLALSQRTVESRTEYFKLVNERFKGGDVAELDMLQADQQLSLAKATVQNIKRQLNGIERSLNILLGQTPQQIPRGIENIDQRDIPLIPEGLPSTLLEQRPDVKKAELILQAETERIGVAQASRFPNLSLTGFLGLASTDLSSLISDASYASNATASILGPVFSFGTNKRRVEIQRKEAEIAANNYINVYISALGEVENSLVSVQTYTEEYEARKHQADAATKALMLSKERYRQGYTDYLEVLVSESSMFEAELQASAIKAQQLTSYINLYCALGGGW